MRYEKRNKRISRISALLVSVLVIINTLGFATLVYGEEGGASTGSAASPSVSSSDGVDSGSTDAGSSAPDSANSDNSSSDGDSSDTGSGSSSADSESSPDKGTSDSGSADSSSQDKEPSDGENPSAGEPSDEKDPGNSGDNTQDGGSDTDLNPKPQEPSEGEGTGSEGTVPEAPDVSLPDAGVVGDDPQLPGTEQPPAEKLPAKPDSSPDQTAPAVVDVDIPQNLMFHIDPYGAAGRGQIYSDNVVFRNRSSVPVTISVSRVYYEFEGKGNYVPMAEPFKKGITKDNNIYLYLQNVENRHSDAEKLVVKHTGLVADNTTETVTESAFSFVLPEGSQSESSMAFQFLGMVSANPKIPWSSGDVKVKMVVSVKPILPPVEEVPEEELPVIPDEILPEDPVIEDPAEDSSKEEEQLPENPDQGGTGSGSGNVDTPPEVPDTPELPDIPGTPEVPEQPETPENPETPVTPENPETPETPAVPETPDTPEAPEQPDTPDTGGEGQKPDEGTGSGNTGGSDAGAGDSTETGGGNTGGSDAGAGDSNEAGGGNTGGSHAGAGDSTGAGSGSTEGSDVGAGDSAEAGSETV